MIAVTRASMAQAIRSAARSMEAERSRRRRLTSARASTIDEPMIPAARFDRSSRMIRRIVPSASVTSTLVRRPVVRSSAPDDASRMPAGVTTARVLASIADSTSAATRSRASSESAARSFRAVADELVLRGRTLDRALIDPGLGCGPHELVPIDPVGPLGRSVALRPARARLHPSVG